MPDVIGMGFPVHFHRREKVSFVDALQLSDSFGDAACLCGGDLRIFVRIEFGDLLRNGLLGLIMRLVGSGQCLDALRFDKRQAGINTARSHASVDGEIRGVKIWEGRSWQSMQSIRRLLALSICSCVGGLSLVT